MTANPEDIDKAYTAESFTVLKGLEPVRARPGMYTRTASPAHIIQEVIDNSADEALAGFARRIKVTVNPDGWFSIKDDGRGIPLEVPPGEVRPAIELAFTTLHAGGKFNKQEAQSAYRFSGGLHGVGVAVTNALSRRLEVEVKRNGGIWRIAFAEGEVVQPLQRVGDCNPKTHGTEIKVLPNPSYFDSPTVSIRELRHLLRSKALLLPGLTAMLQTAEQTEEWCYPQGLAEYLPEVLQDRTPITPNFVGENYIQEAGGAFAPGEGAAWAIAWVAEDAPKTETYVNLIPTLEGGTHEAGFRAGIAEAVRAFMEHHGLMPAKMKLVQEDITSRLALVLSAKVLDPQFQGQTKDKLTNRDAYRLLIQTIRDPLEIWLNGHVEAGKAIAEMAVQAAQRRNKAAQKVEKRKGSGLATLPGKLTDCESTDLSRNELFLVEGDSAGGSAKTARDKEFQAILPLRGKVLNTWEVDRDQIFKNAEVHNMAIALGVDPHEADTDPGQALAGLRYGKVIIFSDADVDGSHIQVLLMTLFLRHFPALLLQGHVWVAKPPLYRVDATAKGKARKIYCEAEAERDKVLTLLKREGVKDTQITVQRFKGLGEMNPEQLWETGMSPDTRTLLPLQIKQENLSTSITRFTLLMGKSEASGRRAWLEADGWKAELDI